MIVALDEVERTTDGVWEPDQWDLAPFHRLYLPQDPFVRLHNRFESRWAYLQLLYTP